MRPLVALLFLALLALPSNNATADTIANLRETGKAFAKIAEKCSPAVVFIKVEKKAQRPNISQGIPHGFPPELYRHFFGQPRVPQEQPPQIGQGTGFIISNDGYVLTNNHVVGGADKIIVTLDDGRELEATIVGADKRSDVAVIKLDAKELPFLRLGNSDTLKVGEWVIAAGNPFGLSQTITAGIVSAKGRNSVGLADYENFIQTDAAINPGNSGGPLINLDGEVVGINTAIYSRSGGYMGIGFAIPINMAVQIKNQLIEHGSVSRGYLGVVIQNITPDIAAGFGLELKEGVLISTIQEDGPADQAGLKRGDVIVALNGEKISEVASFRNKVALIAPETEVVLTVIREDKSSKMRVRLGALPGDKAVAKKHERDSFGFEVQQSERGVVITKVRPGSKAARAGLRSGLFILEAQRREVNSVKDLKKIIAAHKKDEPLILLVSDGRGAQYVVLR